MTSNIKVASEGTGSSIMANNLIDEATLIYNQNPGPHEQHLVNFYTPTLIKVVEEVNLDLRLVNCEYIQWLSCMSGQRKSDLKPDLFSARHPLIQYSPPHTYAPTCVAMRLFGKFISWMSQEFTTFGMLSGKWTCNHSVRSVSVYIWPVKIASTTTG